MPNDKNEELRIMEALADPKIGAILDTDAMDRDKFDYLKTFSRRVSLPKKGMRINKSLPPHFLLASQRHTKKFFLLTLALRYAHISQMIALRLYKLLKRAELLDELDIILGPPMGALPVVYALGHIINSPNLEVGYLTRDWRGNFKLGRGFDAANKKVLIADDVLTSGGSIRKSIAACHESLRGRNTECFIIGAAVAIDRTPLSAPPLMVRAPTLPIVSALTCPVEDYDPLDCPLCTAGHPLWKVS